MSGGAAEREGGTVRSDGASPVSASTKFSGLLVPSRKKSPNAQKTFNLARREEK